MITRRPALPSTTPCPALEKRREWHKNVTREQLLELAVRVRASIDAQVCSVRRVRTEEGVASDVIEREVRSAVLTGFYITGDLFIGDKELLTAAGYPPGEASVWFKPPGGS